jgi:hypothetical protein
VADANPGARLKSVTYRFAWAVEPKRHILDATIMGQDAFILLPSNTDVTLTIESPGYQSWTYPGVINVGTGQDLPLDVQLRPATAQLQ